MRIPSPKNNFVHIVRLRQISHCGTYRCGDAVRNRFFSNRAFGVVQRNQIISFMSPLKNHVYLRNVREGGIEAEVILAYGKTASLSTRNKQFMDHIIRNYPKYQEG